MSVKSLKEHLQDAYEYLSEKRICKYKEELRPFLGAYGDSMGYKSFVTNIKSHLGKTDIKTTTAYDQGKRFAAVSMIPFLPIELYEELARRVDEKEDAGELFLSGYSQTEPTDLQQFVEDYNLTSFLKSSGNCAFTAEFLKMMGLTTKQCGRMYFVTRISKSTTDDEQPSNPINGTKSLLTNTADGTLPNNNNMLIDDDSDSFFTERRSVRSSATSSLSRSLSTSILGDDEESLLCSHTDDNDDHHDDDSHSSLDGSPASAIVVDGLFEAVTSLVKEYPEVLQEEAGGIKEQTITAADDSKSMVHSGVSAELLGRLRPAAFTATSQARHLHPEHLAEEATMGILREQFTTAQLDQLPQQLQNELDDVEGCRSLHRLVTRYKYASVACPTARRAQSNADMLQKMLSAHPSVASIDSELIAVLDTLQRLDLEDDLAAFDVCCAQERSPEVQQQNHHIPTPTSINNLMQDSFMCGADPLSPVRFFHYELWQRRFPLPLVCHTIDTFADTYHTVHLDAFLEYVCELYYPFLKLYSHEVRRDVCLFFAEPHVSAARLHRACEVTNIFYTQKSHPASGDGARDGASRTRNREWEGFRTANEEIKKLANGWMWRNDEGEEPADATSGEHHPPTAVPTHTQHRNDNTTSPDFSTMPDHMDSFNASPKRTEILAALCSVREDLFPSARPPPPSALQRSIAPTADALLALSMDDYQRLSDAHYEQKKASFKKLFGVEPADTMAK